MECESEVIQPVLALTNTKTPALSAVFGVLQARLVWPDFGLRNGDEVLHFGAQNETKCCVLWGLRNGLMELLLELRNRD